MNMYNWIEQVIHERNKRPFPLLSYPAVQELFITVRELVSDSAWQAMGIRLIADRYKMTAATSYMDLSVEAEAFGARCIYGVDDIPTINGCLIRNMEEAEALKVPEVGAGRTGVAVEAVRKALRLINDRPVFANCIGPYSLAGRLMDVNKVMIASYEEPEAVHTVLKKATDFIKSYVAAFKRVGANGVILSEPLAGILSPALMEEFSTRYVADIISEFQDKSFVFIYHNCGNSVAQLIPQVLDTGSRIFHFGNHVNIRKMLENMPSDRIIMGNLDPASVFRNATPRKVQLATQKLLLECMDFPNFLISSGCDIPPDTDPDNLDAFFQTVEANYYKRMLYDLIT